MFRTLIGGESYLDFPRAAELESNGENEFTILASDAQPLIRYRIEAAERRAS